MLPLSLLLSLTLHFPLPPPSSSSCLFLSVLPASPAFIAWLSTTPKLQPSQTSDKYSTPQSTLTRCLLCCYTLTLSSWRMHKAGWMRVCVCLSLPLSVCVCLIKWRSISLQGHFKIQLMGQWASHEPSPPLGGKAQHDPIPGHTSEDTEENRYG